MLLYSSQSVFAKLQHITKDTPEEEYAPIVEVLCLWGMGERILRMISDWLMSGLEVDTPRSKVLGSCYTYNGLW